MEIAYNHVDIWVDLTDSVVLTKSIIRNRVDGMGVTFIIKTETRITEMEGKFRETQSFIAEYVKLFTPGRATNTPMNITLVYISPIGVSGR